tara:strand:- start:874 stop:1026 length:153 start_codon:yes stop_codon:yes gene_type:complete
MKEVTFNEKISYFQVPYYDRYNWDLIDAMRKRDQIIGKWQNLVFKLINEN